MIAAANDPTMQPVKDIHDKVYEIQGRKVILDEDLARLYGVKPKILSQIVKQYPEYFQEDAMLDLNEENIRELNLPVSIPEKRSCRLFTRQGVSSLASLLKKEGVVRMDNEFAMRHFLILYHMHQDYFVWSAR